MKKHEKLAGMTVRLHYSLYSYFYQKKLKELIPDIKIPLFYNDHIDEKQEKIAHNFAEKCFTNPEILSEQNPDDLLAIPNFGKKSLQELEKFLQKHGNSFTKVKKLFPPFGYEAEGVDCLDAENDREILEFSLSLSNDPDYLRAVALDTPEGRILNLLNNGFSYEEE